MRVIFNDRRFKRNQWTFNQDIPDMTTDELKQWRDQFLERIDNIQADLKKNKISNLEPAELKSIAQSLEHIKGLLK